MTHNVVSLKDKFGKFSEHWSPKIIAQVNGMHIKAVKVKGEFVWHKHDDTDEMFIVHKGRVTIRYRDGDIILSAGELHVVPKGVEHTTLADEECEILLVEPAGTVNTGDAGGAKTSSDQWI